MTTHNTFKTIVDALAGTVTASSAFTEDIERFVLIDGRRRYTTIDPPLERRKKLKQSRTTHTNLSFLVLMMLAIMSAVFGVNTVHAVEPAPEWCAGNWDANTLTCTLTNNITDPIYSTLPNLTLDCAGHSITGPGGSLVGIELRGGGVTVENCTVTGWFHGIDMHGGDNYTITNNMLTDNAQSGIYLGGAKNSVVSGNTLTGRSSVAGIYLRKAANNKITGNTITGDYLLDAIRTGSPRGIYIEKNSTDNEVTDNFVEKMRFAYNIDGSQGPSEGNVFTGNTARASSRGFYVLSASNNDFNSNIVDGNEISFDVTGYDIGPPASNNVFIGNTVNSSSGYGYVASLNGVNNKWDGNFWTNPDKTGYSDLCDDIDSDGICDLSYDLGQGHVDSRPLTAAEQQGRLACEPDFASWNQMVGIETEVQPAIAGYTDSFRRLYMTVVGPEGSVHFSKTGFSGNWSLWQPVAEASAPGFATDTAPILVENEDVLYLLARGNDNNLYRSFKDLNNDWSAWQPITSHGRIDGRFSVTLTRSMTSPGVLEAHILYTSPGPGVEYLQTANWIQQGNPQQWGGAEEGTIGSDGQDQVWVAIQAGNQLLIERAGRIDGWNFQPVTTRSASAILDVSSVVFFNNAYHVAYSQRKLIDDVSLDYATELRHIRIRPDDPGDFYQRLITASPAQDGYYPQSELTVYRNKLIMAYKDSDGWVRYVRWDNADSTTPWTGGDIVSCGRTSHRPVIAEQDFRIPVVKSDTNSWAFYSNDNFGHDLFVATTDSNSRTIEFINFSRSIFKKEMDRDFAFFEKITDYNSPSMPINLLTDNRPYLSELGYLLWTLPNWLAEGIFQAQTERFCDDGHWDATRTQGRIQPPCNQVKMSVIMRNYSLRDRVIVDAGIVQSLGDDYKLFSDELLHYLTFPLGIDNHDDFLSEYQGYQGPEAIHQTLSGIPLNELLQADDLFNERTGQCQSNMMTSTGRCRGFTGIGGNYDMGGREHSWIYTMYYYFSNGDKIREMIADDVCAGDNLLERKYNWVRANIYQGVEFKLDNDPVTEKVPDLEITDFSMDGPISYPISGGIKVPFKVTVENTGDFLEGVAYNLALFKGYGGIASADSTRPLTYCGTKTIRHTLTFPDSVRGSNVLVRAEADSENLVPETDESNNEMAFYVSFPEVKCRYEYIPQLGHSIRICE